MIKGSCHCGAVRFEYDDTAERAVSCNCTVCRRLGAVWIYSSADKIRFDKAEDATLRYTRGEAKIGFHSCKTCGCTTHWENLENPETGHMAVNLNMCEPAIAASIPLRHFDGADSWEFLD